METNNSYPGIYLGIICELYRDIAQCYGVTQRTQRTELGVIRGRYAAEGISFLTKGLRAFVKAIDIALATGTRLSIQGFHKPKDSAIPHFLGWLTSRVFSTCGSELSAPDPYALKHLRELCYLYSKLEIPYDEKDTEKVLTSFINVDASLPEAHPVVDNYRHLDAYSFDTCDWRSDEWLETARRYFARVVSSIDPAEIKPGHGPGSVATGEETTEKTNLRRIFARLETVYPFTEYMMYNLNHVAQAIQTEGTPNESVLPPPEGGSGIEYLIPMDEATAKVVLVPKDSRGPRLISCEPLEVQWIQQGLKRVFYDTIERHRLTRGFVNFENQEINRRLALQSSADGQWVTLDMKDASDRVSLVLVKHLCQDHPRLLEALQASRSQSTMLPNGTVIRMKKFAPMGSALCFPVEALCFWVLSVSAIIQHGFSAKYAEKSVYVFGDDLIVRREVYTALLQWLPLVGLQFNESKCCTARFFRESCGCDAYNGVDVTPVKLKTVWSESKNNPKCLESYVAFHNAMYGRGHFHVTDYVASQIERVYGLLPRTNRYVVSPSGSYVAQTEGAAFVCHEPADKVNRELGLRRRFNRSLQKREVQTWTSIPLKRKTKYDGYAELLRRFTAGYGPHGGVYALVRRNRLNRTWMENL